MCVCLTDLQFPRTPMHRLLGMNPYSLLVLVLWLVIALAVSWDKDAPKILDFRAPVLVQRQLRPHCLLQKSHTC